MMDLSLRTRLPLAQSARENGAREAASVEAAVVEVAGELDLHSAPQLRAELTRAIASAAAPRVIVDLSGVGFIDSTGVGVLVGGLKRAREAGGALHFCGAQSRVRRVFEITGLIGALPLYETREAALAAFDTAARNAPENAAVSSGVPQ